MSSQRGGYSEWTCADVLKIRLLLFMYRTTAVGMIVSEQPESDTAWDMRPGSRSLWLWHTHDLTTLSNCGAWHWMMRCIPTITVCLLVIYMEAKFGNKLETAGGLKWIIVIRQGEKHWSSSQGVLIVDAWHISAGFTPLKSREGKRERGRKSW